MIRLDEIPAPADASEIREAELERLRRDFIRLGKVPGSADFGALYSGRGADKPWRAALREGQHYKCAFCESWEEDKQSTVEHFRPKAQVIRGPGRAAEPGYWWLAWTWENLYFCCKNCNTLKGAQFPLERRGRALIAEEAPPGAELPLLIDPRRESAVDHIQFKLIPGSRGTWCPYPRNNSARGAMTIQLYDLARSSLLDQYRDWAALVLEDLEELRERLAARDPDRIRDKWSRVVRRFIAQRGRPFRGLSYDVLDHEVPLRLRQRHQLTLPPP